MSEKTSTIILVILGAGLIFYDIKMTAELVKCKRDEKFIDFFESIINEADKIYFHGFKLKHYILKNEAFLRLQKWLGGGMCYELSALAMILLKDHKTARLCRGDFYDENGHFKTRHSWVEIKVPLNGWLVFDFAWTQGCCRKKDYFRFLKTGKGRLAKRKVFTYRDFWRHEFTHTIWRAMQEERTSCILLELAAFGGPGEGYGFRDYLDELGDKMMFSEDGSVMMPYYWGDTGKPLSTRIIRDFVKNKKRKSPRSKSIRLAKVTIHKYQLWRTEQEHVAS